MDVPDDAVAVRVTLTKEGQPNIIVELHRASPVDFSVVEDGKPLGSYYRTLSPPKQGAPGLVFNDTQFPIGAALRGYVRDRHPGYGVSTIEIATHAIRCTAVTKKESRHDPATGGTQFFASLALLNESGKEYGAPIFLPSFEAVAQLLTREAGVAYELLNDRHPRYDRGEEVRIALTLDDPAAIGRMGFPVSS